ncbi:SusD/RagB family nutrient-binding outer membrane lipoprotein [Reichenbachiella sp. MALMAid0571]|uniref:SusD/RagB family nutrient-binding outer membrane lipoprotein n=1 Tax=Reichenbachiella sp. MALMAid0571 TaxID=3143939 RepID=UPI0032DE60A0
MKNISYKKGILVMALAFLTMSACDDKLSEINTNPFAIDPVNANVNLLMPSVLGPSAVNYLNLGLGNMGGAMQHTQLSGWAGGHNFYDWGGEDWTGYFNILRTNELLIKTANRDGFPFHEGVGLTMRAFLFGQIADYWGDAPYTYALKGDEGGDEFTYPQYDSQEDVYMSVIDDLKAAATLFETGNETGIDSSVDLYFEGDMAAWEKFANSLLIRYYVRISEKSTASKAAIEAIVSSGKFISASSEDATLDYTGKSNDIWPLFYTDEASSTRYQACKTLIDQMNATNDPRISVWFAPVQVRWEQDLLITGYDEDKMRIDGVVSDILRNWSDYRGRTEEFTRHYNPNDVTFDDSEYVGIAPGILLSANNTYNGNTVGGQGRHNIHASMLTETFMDGDATTGDMLQSRLVSAAEMHFTLAEMAINGWNVGDAQTHYETAIMSSLETWGVEDEYATFIADVPFAGTVEQIITQKWVASFTSATEAWNDYKRTGFPVMSVGNGATADVPAIRFGYGGDELVNNTTNVNSAISNLEITEYSGALGKDSPYSKQWLLQGTGKPY